MLFEGLCPFSNPVSTPFVSLCMEYSVPKSSWAWVLPFVHFSLKCWALHWFPPLKDPTLVFLITSSLTSLKALTSSESIIFCVCVVKYTQHKSYYFNHFKVCNSGTFSTKNAVQLPFVSYTLPQKESPYPLLGHVPSLPPTAPGKHWSAFCHCGFAFVIVFFSLMSVCLFTVCLFHQPACAVSAWLWLRRVRSSKWNKPEDYGWGQLWAGSCWDPGVRAVSKGLVEETGIKGFVFWVEGCELWDSEVTLW